jgi:hypothetical protein
MFGNRALMRTFGPKMDEVTEAWRKPHTEELNDLYSSAIIRVIKSRRIRWGGGDVARAGRREVYSFMVGKSEGKGTTWKTQA